MRVLVSGGTGLVGAAIIDQLLRANRGHHVRCLTRRPERPSPWGAAVPLVGGDVRDPASLRRALADTDCVIHCVQFPNHPVENPRKGLTYEAIDGQGTVNLVAACRDAGVRRVIYLSGAGVRAGRAEPWFRAKWRAEEAIRTSGLEYVILRPSWIYGPRDRSLNRFVAFVRYLPVVPVIGNGQNRVQPIFVEDVGMVGARAVDEVAATNQVFELGGPQILTMDEVIRTIQRVLGRRQPLLHHPVGLVKLAARLLALLPDPPLTPSAIDFLLMEELVDPGPAQQTFALQFRSLEEGLRTYLRPRSAAAHHPAPSTPS
ncbi:MAG TPA: NAD(P)H-binding protein [Chloroflexota bacterium]|nr:NAD(P)H-binding protein [Chloroflexota bacterium]